ncbi:hypothetical protein ACFPK1_21205 [Actinomycetospora rhizophila]|uniref:Uncharacterized protein n=1 Tax=Actinomycetospora rhizophila TaxID=1416876 RepID=A0ABV9ZGZ2_9PSEU
MSTDAATPETPVPPDPDGVTDGTAVDGSTASDESAPDESAPDESAPGEATPEMLSGGTAAEPTETDAAAEVAGDRAGDRGDVPALARIPAQAGPVRETTRDAGPGPGPVADDAGGRLTARLREARARLRPEQIVIPAPRTPEGVVPPAPFSRGDGPPPADLLRAIDELAAQLAALEQEDDAQTPDRRALLRALDRSVAGVPDGGWSREDRIDAEALAGASELAVTLHDAAAALVERLDAEERTGPAVEVDAVATALQVARMVLDLEGFARHGR